MYTWMQQHGYRRPRSHQEEFVCPITTVAWFLGVKRVPQTAARVEQISEWISMWRNCNVDTRRRIRRFWRKKAPMPAGNSRRWNQATGSISATICSVLEAGWKPSSPGFWQSPDGSATLDGALLNKAQIIDSFSSDMEMQTWKAAARHSSSSGLEKGIITDFAKKARSQLIKEGSFTAARAFQLLNSSHVRERDKALSRSVMVGGVWNGFVLGKVRGEVFPCRFCGGADGDGHLFLDCPYPPLVEIRENPEFYDLMREDKSHWSRCLLWHGWLPVLSGTGGGSPWAVGADAAVYVLESALGSCSSDILQGWDVPQSVDWDSAAGRVPPSPDVWTDGSLVRDEVSGSAFAGSLARR